MSIARIMQQAAAGAGDAATYVDDVFSTFLYEGTSAVGNVVTNGIDLSGEGGLVWLKSRGDAQSHGLFDTERGAGKMLQSNATAAELSYTDVSSFNSDGFTAGFYTGWFNSSNYEQCSWTFRKQPGFFDVVTYTGNGTAGRTISHNLGAEVGFAVVKRTDSAAHWEAQHRSIDLSSNKGLYLSTSGALGTHNNVWNSTHATSTHLVLGDHADVNGVGGTYVAYLFAHDAQDFGENSDEAIIKCGSYTGSSAGNEINLGFEPQWIIIKRTNAADDWVMYDVMRGMPVGGDSAELNPNASYAENGYFGSSQPDIHPNPTGFTLQGTSSPYNSTGSTYIYIAIRRPHKPASEFAAADLFTPASQNFQPGIISAGFPIDLIWHARQGTANYKRLFDRLRGPTKGFYTDQNNADVTHSLFGFDNMTGFEILPGTTIDAWSWMMFRRAKGFLDIVPYTGTGSATTVTHNLGVAPEMMILKNRDDASSFQVYHSANSADYHLELNNTNARNSNSAVFNSTAPTSSVFSVGTQNNVNGSGKNLMAYLFASVSGISKVGSYTGTGNDVNVNCGFSSGARLVIVKRSDSTGGWYLWDSARGIVAGNDSYYLMNTNAAQVTNTDYIDPLASGFTITSSAPAELNASGGTYVFLAIA